MAARPHRNTGQRALNERPGLIRELRRTPRPLRRPGRQPIRAANSSSRLGPGWGIAPAVPCTGDHRLGGHPAERNVTESWRRTGTDSNDSEARYFPEEKAGTLLRGEPH